MLIGFVIYSVCGIAIYFGGCAFLLRDRKEGR